MDKITEALDKQIEEDLNEIAQMTVDSEIREKATSNFRQLYQLRLEEQRLQQQREQAEWGRKIQLGLDVVGMVLPSGITLFSLMKVLQFEKTGEIITSDAGRKVLGWIRPEKIIRKFVK